MIIIQPLLEVKAMPLQLETLHHCKKSYHSKPVAPEAIPLGTTSIRDGARLQHARGFFGRQLNK